MFRRFFDRLFVAPQTVSKFSLERLQQLHETLLKNQVVSDQNEELLVETLRSLAELIIWGDQHNPAFFEFFLEKGILSLLFLMLKQCSSVNIKKQLIQSISIMIQNINDTSSLYFILSNNHINDLIRHRFQFEDEELLDYYITFLKTISLKLNKDVIQFFYNMDRREFPLYTEAIKFFSYRDGMVRIAVRTITLNVYSVNDLRTRKYLIDTCPQFFSQVCNFMKREFFAVDELLNKCEIGKQGYRNFADSVADQLDHIYFVNDIFHVNLEQMSEHMSQELISTLLEPFLLPNCIEIVQQKGSSSRSNSGVKLELFTSSNSSIEFEKAIPMKKIQSKEVKKQQEVAVDAVVPSSVVEEESRADNDNEAAAVTVPEKQLEQEKQVEENTVVSTIESPKTPENAPIEDTIIVPDPLLNSEDQELNKSKDDGTVDDHPLLHSASSLQGDSSAAPAAVDASNISIFSNEKEQQQFNRQHSSSNVSVHSKTASDSSSVSIINPNAAPKGLLRQSTALFLVAHFLCVYTHKPLVKYISNKLLTEESFCVEFEDCKSKNYREVILHALQATNESVISSAVTLVFFLITNKEVNKELLASVKFLPRKHCKTARLLNSLAPAASIVVADNSKAIVVKNEEADENLPQEVSLRLSVNRRENKFKLSIFDYTNQALEDQSNAVSSSSALKPVEAEEVDEQKQVEYPYELITYLLQALEISLVPKRVSVQHCILRLIVELISPSKDDPAIFHPNHVKILKSTMLACADRIKAHLEKVDIVLILQLWEAEIAFFKTMLNAIAKPDLFYSDSAHLFSDTSLKEIKDIEFHRRLPNNDNERIRLDLHNYLILCHLNSGMNGVPPSIYEFLDFTPKYEAKSQIAMINREVIRCSIYERRDGLSTSVPRYLFFEDGFIYVVSLNLNKMGFAVVRSAMPLLFASTKENNDNRYTMFLLADRKDQNGSTVKIFDEVLVFDDFIKCKEVRSIIDRNIAKVKELKKQVLLQVLQQPWSLTLPENASLLSPVASSKRTSMPNQPQPNSAAQGNAPKGNPAAVRSPLRRKGSNE